MDFAGAFLDTKSLSKVENSVIKAYNYKRRI